MAVQWDAYKVLKICNPDTGAFTCVGQAKTYHRRCQCAVNVGNRTEALGLLATLPGIKERGAFLGTLKKIAQKGCCLRFHQNQIDNVMAEWKEKLEGLGLIPAAAMDIKTPPSREHYSRASSQNSNASQRSIFSQATSSSEKSWLDAESPYIKKEEFISDDPFIDDKHVQPRSVPLFKFKGADDNDERSQQLVDKIVARASEAWEENAKARTAAAIAAAEKEDTLRARVAAEREARIAAEDELREREIKHEREQLATDREQLEKAKKEHEVERARLHQERIDDEIARERLRLERESDKMERERFQAEKQQERALLAQMRAEVEEIKRQALEAAGREEDLRRSRVQTAAAEAALQRKAAEEREELVNASIRASLSAAWEPCAS